MKSFSPESKYLTTKSATLLEAMKLLYTQDPEHQFLIVVDDEKKLVGSLTDGDIRRGLIRGHPLSSNVGYFLHSEPIFGTSKMKDPELSALLLKVKSMTPFLPVVDKNGVLQRILIGARRNLGSVNALIMAGGFGTRLGRKTKHMPKALVEVNGKPLIEHVLDMFDCNFVDRVFISTHYLANKLEEYINKKGKDKRISILREDKPLGTAGALGLLPSSLSGRLLVSNCDIISDVDLASFCDFHNYRKIDALVAVASHETQIPFGVIRSDDDGNFLGIDEKPKIENYVAAGIYCLSPSVYKSVSFGEALDMPTLLNREHLKGRLISIFPLHERWSDVGTVDDLERAEGKQ